MNRARSRLTIGRPHRRQEDDHAEPQYAAEIALHPLGLISGVLASGMRGRSGKSQYVGQRVLRSPGQLCLGLEIARSLVMVTIVAWAKLALKVAR